VSATARSRRHAALALCATALLAAAPPGIARAQPRPDEAELFGDPAPTTVPAQPATQGPATTAAPAADSRGDELLGEGTGPRATGLISGEREDWLKLGGLAYLRASTSWTRGTPPSDWAFASPALLDVYLDARPNDRVRAYALGRLHYDPSLGSTRATALATLLGDTAASQTTRGVLDQLWINFDLGRTVFVTAGKQHVKWGTGRFWNPTDYLHPTRRNPLTQYDERSGVTMVKAHLPWEKRGWNLYGIALLEDLSGGLQPDGTITTVSTLGQVGYGGRAEVVLGSVELAADGMAQKGHAPRFGVDGSFALGELDLRFEVALRKGRDAPRWEPVPGADPGGGVFERYRVKQFDGLTPAAVVGAEWSWKYSDQDSLTVGAEYAYDASGYASADIYPYLLALPNPYLLPSTPDQRPAFLPFYLARQYLGLYLYLPSPGSWNDTTFTLSALGSLTDGSGLVRLDHSVVLNTYLRLETFLAGHVGTQWGEFRFGGTVPADKGGAGLPPTAITVGVPVIDFGVALRVSL
jgi:hypothetical protein